MWIIKAQLLTLSLLIASMATQARAETTNINFDAHNTISTSTDASPKPSQLTYDLYSESLSATYFDGAVNQTRLRLHHPLLTDQLLVYAGINTSSDFTGNSTLRFADSFISPTAGLLIKPFSFLGFFAEYRRLYRTVNNELPDQENDPRYGVYTYFLKPLPITGQPHIEIYGESVALQRFTSQPISTVWAKLGKDLHLQPERWIFTPYLEGFYRESPNLMLGIDERSWRMGGKLKWQWHGASVQMLGYRRFASSSVPLGWEAFLVLSAEGGLPWK